jgi:hypothetical protein
LRDAARARGAVGRGSAAAAAPRRRAVGRSRRRAGSREGGTVVPAGAHEPRSGEAPGGTLGPAPLAVRCSGARAGAVWACREAVRSRTVRGASAASVGPECGRDNSATPMGCGVWPDRRRGWRAASDWGSGLARSWTQTDTRACGGGELCLVVVALQSAEGFGVQHVEVLETGGEPALAEWLGGDMFMGTAGTSGTAYDGGIS